MEKKKAVLTSPLAGEDARRAGEGDIKEKSYFTPSSVCSDFARQTTSPARGEVKQLGFTLIELLVVVLIIGILAAVALPQYQKAVEKSRAAQALALLRTVYESQKAYHMATGSYATTLDELSVDIPWNEHEYWSTAGTENRSHDDWSLQLYRSSNEDTAVIVGRLTGKYAGGAFGYALDNSAFNWPQDQLLCFERTSNGVIFSGSAGDYCQKLFKGSFWGTSGAVRVYVMP